MSVHRADCANAAGLTSQSSRLIEVEWDGQSSGSWVVSIQIEALDRSKLLRDVAQVLADHHVDIITCSTHTTADRVATLHFDFELSDPGHLDSILAAVRRVDSIYEVSRVLPGKMPAH